ncbi:MAG: hypothetical protein HN891_00985 [Planctomycetes bacterium]|jgi:hypothetical protein|nr:hypothetical protein [Planctomycetota bacterium]MBT6452047.1 hypothetical protein [Planctomycetota bacterium]MBT6541911.1 hypothetical protein [Planctomycetota bacterium]MBT6785323.1 hypothetical protein [Planctomycetota bacterium]MBT6968459.1 hypothetical protein [Planctomycetota bacterium]
MMKIGLVTCLEIPEADPDEEIQLEAIRQAGGEASLVPWDDSLIDLSRFDRLILRSCWDYPWRESEFREWLAAADGQTQLLNPLAVVQWNLHKGYLLDLARAGVPVVPTRILAAGQGCAALDSILAEEQWCSEQWPQIVIKPAVSAGSWLTARFGPTELAGARTFVEQHGVDRDLLVQPYIRSVESGGERANVYIAGQWSHCVAKSPRFSGSDEQVGISQPVLAEDLELGEMAIACSPGKILYGRVDTVRNHQGKPMVAELELIEPTLFLKENPAARALFGAACVDRS